MSSFIQDWKITRKVVLNKAKKLYQMLNSYEYENIQEIIFDICPWNEVVIKYTDPVSFVDHYFRKNDYEKFINAYENDGGDNADEWRQSILLY
jgi:hypothetical protein